MFVGTLSRYRGNCERPASARWGGAQAPHRPPESAGCQLHGTDVMWNGLSTGREIYVAQTSGRAGTREGSQDRPQAARRGSLDGPLGATSTMDEEGRQAFLGALLLSA